METAQEEPDQKVTRRQLAHALQKTALWAMPTHTMHALAGHVQHVSINENCGLQECSMLVPGVCSGLSRRQEFKS
jgi:hypothetical protein